MRARALSSNKMGDHEDPANSNNISPSSSAEVSVDNPRAIQQAIMNAFKYSQKAEKESKGMNSTLTSSRTNNNNNNNNNNSQSNISPRRRVSFDAIGQFGGGGALNRSEAALGFSELLPTGTSDLQQQQQQSLPPAPTIQPHQYPKLFSHSGFSPAAEEVFYMSESARLAEGSKNKKKNRRSSARASSASSASSSSRSNSKTNKKNKKTKKNMTSEERRAAQRKLEAIDTIFTGTLPTSDSGSLKQLSEVCMSLRPSAADNLPPSITARFDEVDQHALLEVGPMKNQFGSDAIHELVRRLVAPYRASSWKLSHLEATLCRIRAIYRWITAFISLDAPPLPPDIADAPYLNQGNNINSNQPPASIALNLFPVSSALKSDTGGATKSSTGKKVGIMAPKVAKINTDLDPLTGSPATLTDAGNNSLLPSAPKPPFAVPKWFPYKLQDCDDPDDADYLRSELSEHQPHLVPAPDSFAIGEETSIEVFNTRLGDCHQVSALFSYMIRIREARILPEYSEATDFSELHVPDAKTTDLCSTSERKTVAGPTGRAASKCDAARSPSAARRAERRSRNLGGGSHPCGIVTVRGTLKGCIGQSGKPAGYLPWSWSLLTLPDGNRYLVDISLSMCQISEKFSLVMGQHLTIAENKRLDAYKTAYDEAFSSPNQQDHQHQHHQNASSSQQQQHHHASSKSSKSSSKKVQMQKKELDAKSQAATLSIAQAFQQQQMQLNAAARALEREKQELFQDLCDIIASDCNIIVPSSGSNSSSSNSTAPSIAITNNKTNNSKNAPPSSSNNNNQQQSNPAVLFMKNEEVDHLEKNLRDKPLPATILHAGTNQINNSINNPTFSNFVDAPLVLNAPDLNIQTASSNAQLVPPSQVNQLALENVQNVIKDLEESGSSSNQQQQNQNQQTTRGTSSSKGGKGDNAVGGGAKNRGGAGSNTTASSSAGGEESSFGYPQQSPNFIPPQNSQINESMATSNSAHYVSQHLLAIQPASLLVRSFVPFYFFTPAQEFACSHFPRRAQHMLLSAGQSASKMVLQSFNENDQQHNSSLSQEQQNALLRQPSQGVFKHPFSQGTWESYPRLSTKFLELGLRLKSRARRSVFSIAAPPEYLSIGTTNDGGDPAKIETKLFVFKSMNAHAFHATSPIPPALPQVLLPYSGNLPNNTTSSQPASLENTMTNLSNATAEGGAAMTTLGTSSGSEFVQRLQPAHSDQLTRWIRDQQCYLSKFWSNIISTTPSQGLLQQAGVVNNSNINTNKNVTTPTTANSAPQTSAALRLQESLLPSRGWTSTTCQRSTGTFTHTLTVPEVGVYTCVIGIREVNPHTGRSYEPYFWPGVTYQVTVNFAASTEPLIAYQKESTAVKVVRPLISQLPSQTNVPFAVAPLLPRVRGVAVINAIEKKRPTKQQLLEQQQQLQKKIMILMEKQQAEDREKELAQAALPPVKTATKGKSKHGARGEPKDVPPPEPTELEKLQKQLQQLIQQQGSEAGQKSKIERVKVHLLKWEPATACFQGEVYLEAGNVAIWTILDHYPQDLIASNIFDYNHQYQHQVQRAINIANANNAAAGAGHHPHRGGGGGAGAKSTKPQQQQQSPSGNKNNANALQNQMMLTEELIEDPVARFLQQTAAVTGKKHPPELEKLFLEKKMFSKLIPNINNNSTTNNDDNQTQNQQQQVLSVNGRVLPRSMIPPEQNILFSKFNPLCLPSDLDSRGMDQILQAVVAPSGTGPNSVSFTGTNGAGGRLSKLSAGGGTSVSNQTTSMMKKNAIVRGKRQITPSGTSDGGGVDPSIEQQMSKFNVPLENFTSTLQEATKLHQKVGGDNNIDQQAGGESELTNEQQQASVARSNATTPQPPGGKKHRDSSSSPSKNTNNLHNSPSSGQYDPDSNNAAAMNSGSSTITLSLGNSTVFAVPVWTNISVQRKIQSKDIAVMTNGVGLPHTLGVSEVALGMTANNNNNASRSFRRASTTSSGGAAATLESLFAGEVANYPTATHAIVSSTVIPQQQNITQQDIEARRHSLVFPVVLDLDERNAINLSLCDAGDRHLRAHSNIVGKLFQRKKATF